MHISLVLATVGRDSELYRLFDTLCAQTYADFDTIIVDQNDDDRIERLVAKYRGRLDLRHVRTTKGGHAKANNVGLQYAAGDLIGFPDDDCWYSPDLLERVVDIFWQNPNCAGVSGRETTGKWHPHPGRLDLINLWSRHISFALFYRRAVIAGLGFDESLGIGAGTRWGSGEETDYLIRVMKRGPVHYEPTLVVDHPQWAAAPYPEAVRRKARSYAVGMGHVLKMHRYPFHFFAWQCFRPLVGTALALVRADLARVAYHYGIMAGRAEGWLATPGTDATASMGNEFSAKVR